MIAGPHHEWIVVGNERIDVVAVAMAAVVVGGVVLAVGGRVVTVLGTARRWVVSVIPLRRRYSSVFIVVAVVAGSEVPEVETPGSAGSAGEGDARFEAGLSVPSARTSWPFSARHPPVSRKDRSATATRCRISILRLSPIGWRYVTGDCSTFGLLELPEGSNRRAEQMPPLVAAVRTGFPLGFLFRNGCWKSLSGIEADDDPP